MLANPLKIYKCIYQDFTEVFPQTGGLGFPTFRDLLLFLLHTFGYFFESQSAFSRCRITPPLIIIRNNLYGY